MEKLRFGSIKLFLEGGRICLEVKGAEGAGIKDKEGRVLQGAPVEDVFYLTVEEFMDLLFGLYGIEDKVVLNMDTKRIEVGKSKDTFLKFTNFASQQRTIFYLSQEELGKVLLKAEVLRCSLDEIRFFHNGIVVRFDRKNNTLSFASDEESEELYGYSLFLFKEIIRDGMTYDLGFLTFGAGKLSVVKPSGRIVLGGKWKDFSYTRNFLFAQDREIPKLTAKVFIATR